MPRPNLARLTQGRGRYVSDIVLPRMVHVAFLRSPYAHARILRLDDSGGAPAAGGGCGGDRARPRRGLHALGGRAGASDRAEIGAAASARASSRARWQGEPVAAVAASSRALAEDAAGADRGGMGGTARGGRCAAALDGAADPSGAGRQSGLRAPAGCRRGGRGVRGGGRGGRRDGSASAAIPGSRSRRARSWPTGTAGEQRLTVYQGTPSAAHDAEHLCPASRPRGAAGPGHLPRCRRLVRHQDPRLSGRYGHGRAVAHAGPARCKFVADRLESFVGDIHARDHEV